MYKKTVLRKKIILGRENLNAYRYLCIPKTLKITTTLFPTILLFFPTPKSRRLKEKDPENSAELSFGLKVKGMAISFVTSFIVRSPLAM
jgi:hypothetical protein